MFKELVKRYWRWRDSRMLRRCIIASSGSGGNKARERLLRVLEDDRESPPILISFKGSPPHPDRGGNVYPEAVIEAALRNARNPLPIRASVRGQDVLVGSGLIYPAKSQVLVRLDGSEEARLVRALLRVRVRPEIGTIGCGTVKGGVVQLDYKLEAISLDFPDKPTWR